ncbi:aminoglycoside phosphotransferase family protein [Streptomyces sp. MCA2]|uniref:aminoglycoside phosphotransferase family protein n=1 Tax=Streptomyces sp. MCA2 TaxID=2944805 RepID=UPI002022185A|nr:aminoglycoside phosphotransferase family protein [Streptomyces sp. MCA2]MCL7492842.1 aminoglycoside phosphotransferase family protein [Streptomyces sp. MCA2]
MTKRTLGEIPAGCRRRLLAHYGPAAQRWLDAAPARLARAAERWKLSLGAYHDAGHASVIATATCLDGRPLLLKAWFDPSRYHRELDALRFWAGGPIVGVEEAADDLAVATLELVGGQPGGSYRPRRETQIAAAALHGLHASGRRRCRPDSLPRLADYLDREVWPRLERRIQRGSLGDWRALVEAGLPVVADLEEGSRVATVLHADLYRENVLFDRLGHPRLIDPLPMVGDPAFDWAFWTVYYDLGRATDGRLAIAARVSRIPVPVLAPWCRLLAVDGLLFYVESVDPRAPLMAKVLTQLLASTSRSRS